jgi:hypothetical protein
LRFGAPENIIELTSGYRIQHYFLRVVCQLGSGLNEVSNTARKAVLKIDPILVLY